MAFSLNHSLPMHPFSTTLTVFCYQGGEKGCTGNKWVNIMRDRAHNRPKEKKITRKFYFHQKERVYIKKDANDNSTQHI